MERGTAPRLAELSPDGGSYEKRHAFGASLAAIAPRASLAIGIQCQASAQAGVSSDPGRREGAA